MVTAYSVVGTSTPRIDGIEMVMGRAQFTADLKLPHMLSGKLLRSPYPHALIKSIDIARALKVPGVKAIITGKDVPSRKYGAVPFAGDETAVCIDKVRYVGDEVAAVAAISPDIAEEALELIVVEYEPLDAVFDPLEAIKPGAPWIHTDIQNNISAQYVKKYGDVEAGFAAADHVREDSFYTQKQAHAPLETHAAIASYDPTGKLTIWACKQAPFAMRRTLAVAIGIDESKIRFITPHIGGGFGGKAELLRLDVCAALLAIKTGRPVKIVYDREESITCTRARYPMMTTIKTGVRKDGSIIAQHCRIYADGGAYNSTAPLVLTLAGYFAMLPYKIPHMFFEGYHVYTNKTVSGPMRGHGAPEVRFAVESQVDMIAADLGIDPLDMRLQNAVHVNEDHPLGVTLRSCGLAESMTKAAEAIGWKNRSAYQGTGRGLGLGSSGFVSGVSNMSHTGSAAIIQIHRDGSITLLTGACDIGQGSNTVLAQIAAEALGVGFQDVRITSADTELTPLDGGTFGSGVTLRAGNAIRAAAESAKKKLFAVVALKLGVRAEELAARDHRIFVRDNPAQGLAFREALKIYQYHDEPFPLVGRGFYLPPVKEPTTLLSEGGDMSPAYSFGTQAVDVEVDKETGKVIVNKVVTAHDSGVIINPMATEGQVDGSVVCAMGHTFYENFCMEPETGRSLNPTFMDYKIPTALEVPEMESIFLDIVDPEGPYGAKECGEGTQVFTAPALANAIYNAVGVRIKELPITPEKILAALEAQESGQRDTGK